MNAKVEASAARTLTISRNRAAAAGAYSVETLTKDGFTLCIRKGQRTLAMMGHEATQGEVLGMAAAPALARALLHMIRATEDEEKRKAETIARAALFAAGVELP